MRRFKYIPKIQIDILLGQITVMTDICTVDCDGNIEANTLLTSYKFERKLAIKTIDSNSFLHKLMEPMFIDSNLSDIIDPKLFTAVDLLKEFCQRIIGKYFHIISNGNFSYTIKLSIIDSSNIESIDRVFVGEIQINDIEYDLRIILDNSQYSGAPIYDISFFFDGVDYGINKHCKITEKAIENGILINYAHLQYISCQVRCNPETISTNLNVKSDNILKEIV